MSFSVFSITVILVSYNELVSVQSSYIFFESFLHEPTWQVKTKKPQFFVDEVYSIPSGTSTRAENEGYYLQGYSQTRECRMGPVKMP